MKRLLFLLFAVMSLSLMLTSCNKDDDTDSSGLEKAEARLANGDTGFISSVRFGFECDAGFGTCSWQDTLRACDIMWDGTTEDALEFLETEVNADAFFNIETYNEPEIIGFRFIGFSSAFEAGIRANGDDGSVFRVVETMSINQEATNALGFDNITIIQGEYPMFIDQDTGQRMVYINANLE